MSAVLLFAFPILAIVLCLVSNSRRKIDILVVLHALLHSGLGLCAYIKRGSLMGMDDLGLFNFLILSVIYAAVAFYRLGHKDSSTLKNYRVHSIFLMIFVMAMDGAAMAKDLGLIWIFVEATTISSALLISYSNSKRSLEAAWKYLFICSVGIALAFAGILLLVIAQPEHATLLIAKIDLSTISPFWLKISFVFILIGFGTKMGLAPLHFWMPDAYSEAPAPILALLSGALLNIAFIPILRVDKLMRQSGMGDLVQELYLLLGILSVFTAAVFMLKTKDFKRLLAYSSIENMGLIMIAFGMGGMAYYAGYMHIVGHSLIKAAFFLTAGNALTIYNDKNYDNTGGLLQINRGSAWLWLISSAMLIGLPPSPLFTSKFLIAISLLKNGSYLYFGLLMLLLAVISWAIFNAGLKICLGDSERKKSLNVWLYLAPAGLLFIAALIGIFLPVMN
ncbi:MAG: NADH-quinone oxidoreductase subunit F [Candidatus Cloacimonetes bacterium]|jgi:hydrogenase-4 component F|nr:NADH-quinone oxidoreductase subunit F [Candidatus Cloacimonadota bacterium]MDY0173101.1 proton-conducting transporter membrane subunit [Candidatus Cloacimonadaceae bacterium]